MDARRWHLGRRDIDAVLDELEVRFLLDPDTAFDTSGGNVATDAGHGVPGHDAPDGGAAAATNPGRPAQPGPPNRR